MQQIKDKKKILIDLDSVLNDYKEFNEEYIPEIKDGAGEFLEKLSEKFDLCLFTSRNLLLATKWIIDNDLDKFFKDITNTKIPAYLYIDDRAITFNGNYGETLIKIKNFSVYWENNL